MSRKRSKRKRRCCALCKPSKRGQSNRWKPREEFLLKSFERALKGVSDWNQQ